MEKYSSFKWLKRIAKNERSRRWIEKIERWRKLAFEQGKFLRSRKLFSVDLGRYKIWFRKCSAYSSVDIYTEIFKEHKHFLISEFSGENANLVVDLGANEGYYTLKLKQNNAKCKVIAIEPNPLAFEILKKNLESNKLRDVILVNKAICSKSGKMSFEMVANVSAIGAKNLRIMRRPWLKKEMIEKIKVDCITLSELFENYKIEKVDILKLDVEGMELEILKSGKNLLNKICKIVVEWHSKEIKDRIKKFLKEKGFKLIFEEEKECGDLYFVNSRCSGK